MGKLSQYFKVGLVAYIVIGFLTGDLNRLHWDVFSLCSFLGGWFGMSCVIGIPAVEIYHRFLSKEKKKESGKAE